MSEPSTSSKACDVCGNAAPYEPVLVGGVDIGSRLPHFCEPCTKRRQEEEAAREREAVQAAHEAELCRIVPPRMRKTDIHHPGFNLKAWRAVERWSPHEGRWLVLLGETGLCKTRMLALIAMRLIRRGVPVAWTTSIGFQAAALREHDNDPRERAKARELLALWKSVPVLVVDDFGKEAGDGGEAFAIRAERHFFDIFDHRLNHDLPVLLSCNTHPQDMLDCGVFTKDRGGPLVGRILEGAGEVLKLTTAPRQLEL